ncbi:hypothetical protein [Arthrobacter sp. PAMC 25486]|uniref:hypothetical protein n=1 Tax=Arthrobacter sp. PAMC 25486 TaxID=1494608 RepID=UPI0006914718|nr:hypothetical protein [Arthrobacter sp. PAMC 25486]
MSDRAPQTPQQLQITLSDIAALAQVQRPVVSMWRSRSRNTGSPFPTPTGRHGRQELFSAADITDWLTATGRGNNPHAAEDAAAFAAPLGPETRNTHFTALTALLALRCLADMPLGGQVGDDLLDLADEIDPDDEFLFAELEGLGPELLPLAAYADLLTDASYTSAAAFEQLLKDRFRAGPSVHADTLLAAEAVDLVAATAVELAVDSEQPPVFMDDGGSDFLLAVADILGEVASGTLCVGTWGNAAARLARRRMHVHGRSRDNVDVANQVSANRAGPARMVRLAQFPSPSQPITNPAEILTAIDEMALGMDGHSSAVVLAPAAILTDALQRTTHNREAEAIRSDVLRSGRLRAIVRLPRGLMPTKPRQAQALWVLGDAHAVLGDAHARVNIADRWTMVADLSGAELTMDVRQDLVSDLAASLGTREEIRAHSFRFARLVPTRSLLAGSGSLTAETLASNSSGRPAPHTRAAAAELIQAEAVLDAVNGNVQQQLLVSLAAGSLPTMLPTTVSAALKDGSLKYLQGHRIADAHMGMGESARAPLAIIGVAELTGNTVRGSRHISQLVFADSYPQGRLTEPGDVIFTTGAQGGAMVDEVGAAVVLYPARILRINTRRPRGLMPAILAQDVGQAGLGPWKQRPVRRIDDGARPALGAALAEVAAERRRLAVRLQQLDGLSGLLMDGAAHGSFEVLDMTDLSTTMEGTS